MHSGTPKSRSWAQRLRRLVAAAALALLALPAAQAHLMVAQRGTLNLVGQGGFTVMSVPVPALRGVDDDADGRLSLVEMRAHAGTIEDQVRRGLQLLDGTGALPLEGLLLNLSPDDGAQSTPATHLVVMGRFAITDGSPQAVAGLTLRYSLFGSTADTQQQTITVTHGQQATKLVLRPGREAGLLFPSAWAVLQDNARLGAAHVLGGLDHLLFLLVVLATGWGWRRAALGLTVFTAGHGLSLAAVALGGLEAPSHIVEPAIAATIIAMALLDRWSQGRSRPLAPAWRLAMVFACALIHGLGLAGALSGLQLDEGHRLTSVIGFNAGIEAAQLGVALAAAVLLSGLKGLCGAAWLPAATRLASNAAILTGSVWLAQRAVWA